MKMYSVIRFILLILFGVMLCVADIWVYKWEYWVFALLFVSNGLNSYFEGKNDANG